MWYIFWWVWLIFFKFICIHAFFNFILPHSSFVVFCTVCSFSLCVVILYDLITEIAKMCVQFFHENKFDIRSSYTGALVLFMDLGFPLYFWQILREKNVHTFWRVLCLLHYIFIILSVNFDFSVNQLGFWKEINNIVKVTLKTTLPIVLTLWYF